VILPVTPEVLLILVLVAFAAGTIDSIAGGGGLLALPAILLAGAPPVTALATNKLQGMFGTASAALHYARAGQVDLRSQAGPALVAAAAAGCGALLASRLPAEAIRAALPVLLIAVALYFGLRRGLNDEDRAQRITAPAFNATAVPGLAFYDGILGPAPAASSCWPSFLARPRPSQGHRPHQAPQLRLQHRLAAGLRPGGPDLVARGPRHGRASSPARRWAPASPSAWSPRDPPLLVTVSVALALRLLWQAWFT
jgi:hypothetical protein